MVIDTESPESGFVPGSFQGESYIRFGNDLPHNVSYLNALEYFKGKLDRVYVIASATMARNMLLGQQSYMELFGQKQRPPLVDNVCKTIVSGHFQSNAVRAFDALNLINESKFYLSWQIKYKFERRHIEACPSCGIPEPYTYEIYARVSEKEESFYYHDEQASLDKEIDKRQGFSNRGIGRFYYEYKPKPEDYLHQEMTFQIWKRRKINTGI